MFDTQIRRKAFTIAASAAASAAAALGLTMAPSALAHETDQVEMSKGEAKLAKLLEGRVAGEPVTCIPTRMNNRMRVIDGTAYVFGSGKTIYVQRTHNPEDIDDNDMLIQRRFSASHLCKLDMATTAERHLGMFTGAVFYEDFVPYTRVVD